MSCYENFFEFCLSDLLQQSPIGVGKPAILMRQTPCSFFTRLVFKHYCEAAVWHRPLFRICSNLRWPLFLGVALSSGTGRLGCKFQPVVKLQSCRLFFLSSSFWLDFKLVNSFRRYSQTHWGKYSQAESNHIFNVYHLHCEWERLNFDNSSEGLRLRACVQYKVDGVWHTIIPVHLCEWVSVSGKV